jgi:beta-glucanase (GH16 family)
MSPAAPAGLTSGTVLTYNVFEPAGLALSVSPYTADGTWTYAFASPVTLTAGAWTTVTLTVPPLQGGLRYFGIEIENGDGAAGTLYLDAVGWPSASTSSSGTQSSSSTTASTSSVAGPNTPEPSGDPGSWRLVFDDEFAGTSLDPLYWSTGWFGSGITGTVAGASENDCYDPAQVVEANGELDLNLVARQETCDGTTKDYATGFVTTDGLFSYTYGFVEARIWLPGSGSVADWPSFWLDGQNWPTDGELDVVEGLGGEACAHWHGPTGNGQGFAPNGGTGCPSGTFAGGWHTFGADWEPGIVTWYYDGHDIGCVESSGSACGPFNSTITGDPMYMILGLGAGSSTIAPASQRVDYVRAWQH